MALALSLCFNLSIYLYVCYFDSIIARILRGVRTYITIPPIRVLFLFTKKQCHSVLYLSEFTRHSKLLKYKSDHRMAWTWTINLRKTFWFDFFFAGTRWTHSNSHFCLILFWKQRKNLSTNVYMINIKPFSKLLLPILIEIFNIIFAYFFFFIVLLFLRKINIY